MSNLNVVLKIPYFCDRHLDRHKQRARTMSQVQVTKVESPVQHAKLGKQGAHPRVTFPSPYVPTKRHWKCSWFSKQTHKSVIYKQLRAARVQYLYNTEAKWMGTRFSISETQPFYCWTGDNYESAQLGQLSSWWTSKQTPLPTLAILF